MSGGSLEHLKSACNPVLVLSFSFEISLATASLAVAVNDARSFALRRLSGVIVGNNCSGSEKLTFPRFPSFRVRAHSGVDLAVNLRLVLYVRVIQPGSKLTHYEVISAIGTGGIREVWRSRSLKIRPAG